jgi:acyl carrier protein
MGLDSVELVMEVENYFQISIPDPEAEKVHTVQELVETVARHLNVTNNDFELRNKIFNRVNQALLNLKLCDTPIALKESISKYISPINKETWDAFKNELQLQVPKPDTAGTNSNNLIDKIKSALIWKPMYNWQTITVEQFVTAICANNHDKLINRININSIYEIYVGIMAITVNKIGVDYYEIELDKSFTTDLGVD